MKKKFNIDSLYRVKGIPLRNFLLGMSVFFFLLYFLLGNSHEKLIPISGTVKEARVSYEKKIGVLRFNFELFDRPDTFYIQKYYIDTPAKLFLGLEPENLVRQVINPGDKIFFFYSPKEQSFNLKSGIVGVKTYGLYINNKQLIDVEYRKFITFGIAVLATIGLLFFIAFLLLVILDIVTFSKNTKINSSEATTNQELANKLKQLKKQFKDQKVEDLTDSNLENYLEMTDLYWIVGNDYATAERNYIELLAQHPQNSTILFMFSQLLISKQEFERADVLLEKIYKLDKAYKDVFIDMFKNLEDEDRLTYWKNRA